MENNKNESTIYWISLVSAILMIALAIVISLFEMYVRWQVNKDFTFLGGGELAALTVSGTVLLLGLLHTSRSR
jgi:hypothetical protein